MIGLAGIHGRSAAVIPRFVVRVLVMLGLLASCSSLELVPSVDDGRPGHRRRGSERRSRIGC